MWLETEETMAAAAIAYGEEPVEDIAQRAAHKSLAVRGNLKQRGNVARNTRGLSNPA